MNWRVTGSVSAADVRRVGVGLIVSGAVHVQSDLLAFAATVVWTHCVNRHFQLHLYYGWCKKHYKHSLRDG